MSILTEAEIADLLADPKPVTAKQLQTLLHPRHPLDRDLYGRAYVRSKHQRKFQLTARLGNRFPHDFSVHLSRGQGKHRRNLIRCDGFQGRHTNWIEKRQRAGIQEVPANTFHVHRITERYQLAGRAPEYYAEPTTEFWDFTSAVHFLCANFGCYDPASQYPGGKRDPLF